MFYREDNICVLWWCGEHENIIKMEKAKDGEVGHSTPAKSTEDLKDKFLKNRGGSDVMETLPTPINNAGYAGMVKCLAACLA